MVVVPDIKTLGRSATADQPTQSRRDAAWASVRECPLTAPVVMAVGRRAAGGGPPERAARLCLVMSLRRAGQARKVLFMAG